MYIHLTTHSAFSLQEGLMLPAEIASTAQEQGMPAVGLTDHRLLSGAVAFVTACRQNGVQPIIGLEVDISGGKLALLACGLEGWANLCRISSKLMLREEPETDCPYDLLQTHHKDLIALAALHQDAGFQLISGELKNIFPEALYLSLNDPNLALKMARQAKQASLPCVVNHPVYYRLPEQAALQRTLAAIRLNCRLDELPVEALAPRDAYFMSAEEMERRFSHFPTALAAGEEIAARCKFDLPLGKTHMPRVPLPAGLTASQYLRQKAEDGAKQLYGSVTPDIQERLNHELTVIAQMGYEPIFLIVEEILNYAREQGVPYSSRGSAASSLVAHCLNITGPDPLDLNLYFERFLNPARSTPPDIDTDLCSRRRDAVIKHVFDTYGVKRVSMVGTINRFRPRSALGDVAKAHGWTTVRIRELTNQLPGAFFARRQEEEKKTDGDSPFRHLRESALLTGEREVIDEAEALLKLPRHLSVHAGGLVIAPDHLTDLIALMPSGNKGINITQFELEDVEALGLVKIDLLGIRGLTVLGDVAEFVGQNGGDKGEGQTRLAVLDSVPDVDEETSNRIEIGQTIGCFQIESPGMRATLREIHARSEADIMAALALYRPGPLNGGLKDAFVRRYKGEETVTHLHSRLMPLLDETYGVILYQEQVLRIAHELAGFSLSEADLLRRAMGHFDPGKQMQRLEEKFIDQMQQRSDAPLDVCRRVWEMMAAFAGYGFPKAHAASYARVAWRSAWCKTYFPAEFMAAVLANHGGYYSQRVYLNEARRMGLCVYPPDVNFSKRNFSVQDIGNNKPTKALFMGLDQVKGLTQQSIQLIIHKQPFDDLEDFLMRVNPRRQEVENLTKVGALKEFGNIPYILQRLDQAGWQARQMSLFGGINDLDVDDWPMEQKAAAQLDLLGISLEANPLEFMAETLIQNGAINTLEAVGQVGKRVKVAGMRQSAHRSRTTKGETMMFLSLEDLTGMLDVIIFPDVYRKSRAILNSNEPFLVSGVMALEKGESEPFLRADRIDYLSSRSNSL